MQFSVLQPHTLYTHGGDFFSKLQFLEATTRTAWNILHIIPDAATAKKYSLIAAELGYRYFELCSYHDITELSQKKNTIYYITTELLESILHPQNMSQNFSLSIWDTNSLEQCMKELQELGYDFSEYEKAGSYSRNWDILKIFYPDGAYAYLSFWWNELESIASNLWKIDSISLYSLKNISEKTDILKWKLYFSLKDILRERQIFCVLDMLEFHPLFESLTSQDFNSAAFTILGTRDLQVKEVHCTELEDFKKLLTDSENTIEIYTRHQKMMQDFLRDNSIGNIEIYGVKTHLLKSFRTPDIDKKQSFIALCDDVIQKIFIKRRSKKKLSADVDLLLKIQSGDYVVHIDHGIGLFWGIVKKSLGSVEKEYMEISYKDADKLFVPITEVHRVSKYVGRENPLLTPLSGKVWEKKMKKIHEDIREIAEELLKNFAERKIRGWVQNLLDSEKMRTFQNMFPYAYTEDQAQSIEDIHLDMQSDKNMDRLVVWDVGFGKTEVAFNAAYLALMNKKQVILISPLVVLAHEHYSKAVERFAGLWIRIDVLTRLQTQAHATRVLKWLADGTIDMVIGTHRLLSDKLVWKRLGLMIVDEEHKFGVVDKEKIKNIKSDIDILSLSATPIPRSLNLALSGVRDISLLKTPPSGRKSIETYVCKMNDKIIQDAGNKEFARGGQIFFVHNRVSNIEVYKKQLQALFPKKKIIITHGQLPGDELEDRILDFKNKKYDILLSTTVIENGIDFSNVNTIFINECQSFWISQIHQLRGRVWRSDAQWYCYLLYKKEHLDGEAAKRIQTIVDYSYLWAGFELAMKDLEIRGGWDILGVKQSGQAQEIGVSLFLKMLEEKIEDLKNNRDREWTALVQAQNSQIDLMITAGIPDSFFLSETDKLHFYREIELIESVEDLEYLKQSFFESDSTLEIPEETENLFMLLECQILGRQFHIQNIRKLGINYQIDFSEHMKLDELKAFLKRDSEVKFQVVDISKLRSPTKVFANDKKFIEYMLRILQWNVSLQRKKIKLASKA